MWPCCNNGVILLPNPCAGSTPCEQWVSSDCVKINGTLTCGGLGPNPILTTVLQQFCAGFSNIGNEIVAIDQSLSDILEDLVIVDNELIALSGCCTGNTEAITLLQADQVFTSKTVLVGTQVQNLHGTPVELIPAPVTGFHIQVIAATVQINFGTVAYTTGTLQLIEGSSLSTDVVGSNTSILLAVGSFGGTFEMTVGGLVGIGANVRLFVPGSNPATGDGGLTIYVTYKLISL